MRRLRERGELVLTVVVIALPVALCGCASPTLKLFRAVELGNVDGVKTLLAQGVDVNARNEAEETPLHRSRAKDVAELLVGQGANINARDIAGNTPLHNAVVGQHKELVKFLIEKEADVNARNSIYGATPLHFAVRSITMPQRLEIQVRVDGSTMLVPLLPNGQPRKVAVVELLLANGADVNAKDNDARTALHWAATSGQKGIAELLVSKGADVSARDNEGQTPLQLAASAGHPDVVEMLRRHGRRE